MAKKNLDTYLSEQEAEYLKLKLRVKKRRRLFEIKLAVFAAVFAVLVVGMIVMNAVTRRSTHDELMSADMNDRAGFGKIASSIENITAYDVFDRYEDGYLGNRSMNALNYGFIAENHYGYTSLNEMGETILHSGDKETVIAHEAISQINIGKDVVVFRGADKKMYSCRHDGSDRKELAGDSVGTVVLAGDSVYYVNVSKSNHLYKYTLSDSKTEPVLETEVDKFIIAADCILYTDYSNRLIMQKTGSPAPSWADDNVVKFYFNGDIFVQNNDKVIRFNINNHFPKEVASGINELMGVDENNIYYTVENKLYSQSISSGEKTLQPYSFDYFKGVYCADGKIIALGGVMG